MSSLQVTLADAKTKNLPVRIKNPNDLRGIWLRTNPNQPRGDPTRNVANNTEWSLVGSGEISGCVEVYNSANNQGWVKMSHLEKMEDTPASLSVAPASPASPASPSVAPASPSVAPAPSTSDITAVDANHDGLLVLARRPILLRTRSDDVIGERDREVVQGTRMRLNGDGVENKSVHVSVAESDDGTAPAHGWAYMQDLQLAYPREKSAEDIFYENLDRALRDPDIIQIRDSEGRDINQVLQSTNLRVLQKFVPNDYEGFKLNLRALMTSAPPRALPTERFGEGGSHRRKGKGKPSRRSRRSKRNRKNTHKRRHHRR